MERLREAPPAAREDTPPVQSLPTLEVKTVPLLERLEELRQPGVMPDEVDSFLAGLSAPLPPGEPPRVRADLMLDVLDDERLCGLTGTRGQRVGETALESLLGLGYPYAMEVTPEMLARARGRPASRTAHHLLTGLGLSGTAAQLPLLASLYRLYNPLIFEPRNLHRLLYHLTRRFEQHPPVALPLLVPAVLSALAGALKRPSLQLAFNAMQWLVALVYLLGSLPTSYRSLQHMMNTDMLLYDPGRVAMFASGVLGMMGAWVLRPRPDPENEP